jgi:hypothetical protein
VVLKRSGKSIHILEEECLRGLMMWLQKFVPPPTCFLAEWIIWKCWDIQSFFTLFDFGQTYGSNGLKIVVEVPLSNIWRAHPRGYFTCGDMSSPTKFTRVHLGFSENKKSTSSNVSMSIWMRSIPSCTSHKVSKACLLSAYILLVLPTQNIRSSWQNQNLCSSIDTTLATNYNQHNKELQYHNLFVFKWF